MAKKFKAGDIVQLKSGGPKMAVTKVGNILGDPTVWCAWFAGAKHEAAHFSPDTLVLAPEEKPTK